MTYTFADKLGSLKPSMIREILKSANDKSVIPFSAGNPSSEAFPAAEIAGITADILANESTTALQYGITEGYAPLIGAVKQNLAAKLTIADTDDVIITSGAQQAIELSARAICNPGDRIMCENPTFIGGINAFKAAGLVLSGVDVEEDGINIEAAEKAASAVKMIYVIPNSQNPTGVTMSLEKRKALYQIACKHNLIIIEDDPYGDISFSGKTVPPIKSFDTEGRVIYAGSFSKTIAPALRIGFALCNKEILQKFVILKQITDVHTTSLSQMICYRFMRDYDYNAHLDSISRIYKNKCSLMLEGIEEHLSGVEFTRPDGGLFIWCTLPSGIDLLEFAQKAIQRKVAIVPGIAFLTDENQPSSSFRLNFSTPSEEAIVKGIRILGEVFSSAFNHEIH
ncbi:MAG: PLP-dependent aminotransferase family protein [Oscillospiraceae bacterium]|nr:PLP-dependent aminotransferase family protein [Oscillospiraceae bacterium]